MQCFVGAKGLSALRQPWHWISVQLQSAKEL